MKPFLYQRLTQALLAEMASGAYSEGDRFLSLRQICRLWDVSEPTARSSVALLTEAGLIHPVSRSGMVLQTEFRKRALLLLHLSPGTSLPPPATWQAKRWQLLREVSSDTQRRIAMVLEAPGIDASYADRTDLAALAATRTFFQDAQRDECDALYFYHDGTAQSEQFILNELATSHFDAVVVFRLYPTHSALLVPKLLSSHRIPVVTVFDDYEGANGFSINFHNIGAGYDAARELLKHHSRKVAALLPAQPIKNSEQRLEGFLLGINKIGGPQAPETEVLRLPNKGEPLDEIRQHLNNRTSRPSAIFAPGISTFLNLKRRAAAEGWRIPRNIRILGCGDPTLIPHGLTSVDLLVLDFAQAGRRAYRHVQNILNGSLVERTILVPILPARTDS